MKAKPYRQDAAGLEGLRECEPDQATHLLLHLPGPLPNRMLPVMIKGSREGTPCWTWNGDVQKPTLRPSILSRLTGVVCHTWITDGQAQFLGDCTHEFAGQTLDLLDVD